MNKQEILNRTVSKGRKCVFWAGAGISVDSGAPLAKDLSNSILHSLCAHDSKLLMLFFDQPGPEALKPPSRLLRPWRIMPSKIIKSNKRLLVRPPVERYFLRLEVALQALKEGMPEAVDYLFQQFETLEPNINHYVLATAVQQGHSIITTNWDNLIERAAQTLGTEIPVRIWNPLTDNIDERGPKSLDGSGFLFKIHGSIGVPVAFIHQFTIGAPKGVKDILWQIIENRDIIFIGYSFGDYFDYEEILAQLDEVCTGLLIIDHNEHFSDPGDWEVADSHPGPLSSLRVESTTLSANTMYFLNWMFGNTYNRELLQPLQSRPHICADFMRYLNGCPPAEKELCLMWLLLNTGSSRDAYLHFADMSVNRISKKCYYVDRINRINALYLEGKLKACLSQIDGFLLNMKEKRFELSCSEALQVLELLDRGIEAALSVPSRRRALRYRREAFIIGQRLRSVSQSNSGRMEVYLAQLEANVRAILQMVPPLLFIMRRNIDPPLVSNRSFFMLDRWIYFKRSRAISQRDYCTVSNCYNDYLEMCDIDEALGTLIDLAVFSAETDMRVAREVLRRLSKVLRKGRGSIFARVKGYACIIGFNCVLIMFLSRSRRRQWRILKSAIKKYIQSLRGFDTLIGSCSWLIRSVVWFACKIAYRLFKGLVRARIN